MEQANKLVQELNDRKKELKAAIFGNQLLSFIPSGHTSLGKLVFRGEPFDADDFLVQLEKGRSIAKLSPCEQLDDSTAQLTKMSKDSKLTTRENCDSLLKKVDLPREITTDNIRKASNTLMPETDGYERECLSISATPKEKACLQSVQSSHEDSMQRLVKINMLFNELRDFTEAISGIKDLSFIPGSSNVSLGKLVYTTIRSPSKTRGITDTTPSSSRLTSMATTASS